MVTIGSNLSIISMRENYIYKQNKKGGPYKRASKPIAVSTSPAAS